LSYRLLGIFLLSFFSGVLGVKAHNLGGTWALEGTAKFAGSHPPSSGGLPGGPGSFPRFFKAREGRPGLLAGTGKRFGLEVVMTGAMQEAQAKLAIALKQAAEGE